MQCEICNQPATIQVTEVNAAGEPTNSFFCNAHAPPDLTSENPAIEILLPFLRNLRGFIASNNRLPSADEVAELGGYQALPSVAPGTPAFNDGVAHLERLIAFIDEQQRLPEPNEMAIDPPSWYAGA